MPLSCGCKAMESGIVEHCSTDQSGDQSRHIGRQNSSSDDLPSQPVQRFLR